MKMPKLIGRKEPFKFLTNGDEEQIAIEILKKERVWKRNRMADGRLERKMEEKNGTRNGYMDIILA